MDREVGSREEKDRWPGESQFVFINLNPLKHLFCFLLAVVIILRLLLRHYMEMHSNHALSLCFRVCFFSCRSNV